MKLVLYVSHNGCELTVSDTAACLQYCGTILKIIQGNNGFNIENFMIFTKIQYGIDLRRVVGRKIFDTILIMELHENERTVSWSRI